MAKALLSLSLAALTFELHGPGALSYTPVLEAVAQRRIAAGWGLTGPLDSAVLVAVADCGQLGKRGWLLTDAGQIHSVIVVDCSQAKHRRAMIENGILADTNDETLANVKAWMVVR